MNTFPRLSAEELSRLRGVDFSASAGFVSASEHLAATEGLPGTAARIAFEARAQAWYRDELHKPSARISMPVGEHVACR